ncbi:unnamed protein product, partial [Ixodes pacificus]
VFLGTGKSGKRQTFQYVSICKMLRCILENPVAWSDFQSQPEEDGYLSTVFDGTAHRDHAYFQGKHKLTAVYFSVLNFPQKVRSRLSGIHLALLVKDKFVASYGLHKIFDPLVRDIAELEKHGIIVNGEVIYGSVLAVT